MKTKSIFIAAALCLSAMAVTSCDDDKVYDMGHSEASLISEIHFDYEGELTLPVGLEVELNTTALPEEAASTGFIYKSTDEKVAYIDDAGKLHCVGVGTANVSAVPSIGFGATASLTVNVVEKVNYTQSLTLSLPEGTAQYLYEGDTFKLNVTAAPADHTYSFYKWASSNTDVIAVDDEGNVTCGKPGKATVSCETVFPDKAGVNGQIELTVNEPVDVQSLVIAPVTEEICVTRPFDLNVTYTPAYGTLGSVKWESSDENVAVVNRGHVTPIGFGSCTLTATCTNGSKASVEITVTTGWYIWDPANSYNPWTSGSNAKFTFGENGILRVQMSEMKAGGNWRGDIKLVNDAKNPVSFHFGKYPVVAIRATIPANGRNTFDAVDVNNVNAGNPQCNEGRYATGDPITLADGSKLIYVDFGARGKYSTTEITQMKLFQVKVADVPAADVPADKSYTVYWIRTFRSVKEMKAFAEAEVAAGK